MPFIQCTVGEGDGGGGSVYLWRAPWFWIGKCW